jgi:putative tricarboxylic transport membrane protein
LKDYDFIPGVFFLILGLLIAYGAINLGLGNFHHLGVGMVPFLFSLLIILMSITILASSHNIKRAIKGIQKTWSGVMFKKLVPVCLYLVCYGILIETAGYIVTTLLFFLIILKTISQLKFSAIAITSILVVAISYCVFVVILNVQLPSGMWVTWMY